jgi:vanillate O-demethylase ferredoxin subunit
VSETLSETLTDAGIGTIDVRVASKRREAEDIMSFELVPAGTGRLAPFSAGAHIDVHTPAGLIRQYSLCNESAGGVNHYRIAVLRDSSSRGGSKAMHDLVHEGDLICISEPRNRFPLVGTGDRPLLLAGGIGVTPIWCMAQRLARAKSPFEMHYCTRSRSKTAFYDEIVKSTFGSQVLFHFDDGPSEQRLDLSGLLADPFKGRHVYICGPSGFLDAVRTTTTRQGWPKDHVHFEYFSATVAQVDPLGAFEVQIAGTGAVYTVPPDKSIVEVLAEHGLQIPVSCEQGICGTCITRVLSGIPDHRDSIFTDQEKEANNQLTPCCSRSLSPRLILDI